MKDRVKRSLAAKYPSLHFDEVACEVELAHFELGHGCTYSELWFKSMDKLRSLVIGHAVVYVPRSTRDFLRRLGGPPCEAEAATLGLSEERRRELVAAAQCLRPMSPVETPNVQEH